MISNEKLKNVYGLTKDEIEEMEISADNYDEGKWPKAKIRLAGRPFKYNTKMKSITYRDTMEEIARMDERASSLDMSRSDYLRYLVHQDLSKAQ